MDIDLDGILWSTPQAVNEWVYKISVCIDFSAY